MIMTDFKIGIKVKDTKGHYGYGTANVDSSKYNEKNEDLIWEKVMNELTNIVIEYAPKIPENKKKDVKYVSKYFTDILKENKSNILEVSLINFGKMSENDSRNSPLVSLD